MCGKGFSGRLKRRYFTPPINRTVGLIKMFYPFTQSADIYFDRERNAPLYVDVHTNERRKTKRVLLTFIPYYAWANRAATPMQVWTPVLKS